MCGYHAETRLYPDKKSGKVKYGRLAQYDENYLAIDAAFDQKIRGLQDSPYKSLHEYLLGEGFLKISLEQIVDSALKTKAAEGSPPGYMDGVILYGALANGVRTWESVSGIVYKSRHYLTDPGMPYKTLREAFLREGVIVDIDASMIDDIAASARETKAQTGKEPPAKGGMILYGPLANLWKWSQIEEAAHSGKLGPYRSLHKLLVGKGIVEPHFKNTGSYDQASFLPPVMSAA